MSIRNEVIRLIEQENVHPIPVTEDTDLYRDLHFDSLSFVSLLTKLEKAVEGGKTDTTLPLNFSKWNSASRWEH